MSDRSTCTSKQSTMRFYRYGKGAKGDEHLAFVMSKFIPIDRTFTVQRG